MFINPKEVIFQMTYAQFSVDRALDEVLCYSYSLIFALCILCHLSIFHLQGIVISHLTSVFFSLSIDSMLFFNLV